MKWQETSAAGNLLSNPALHHDLAAPGNDFDKIGVLNFVRARIEAMEIEYRLRCALTQRQVFPSSRHRVPVILGPPGGQHQRIRIIRRFHRFGVFDGDKVGAAVKRRENSFGIEMCNGSI